MNLLLWLALFAWLWLLLAHGRFWLPELAAAPPPAGDWPEVVAVIPARDEAAVIGRAVASLLTQDYPGRLSVVVVDDSSTDGTAEAAREAAAFVDATERLTVVTAPPPEPGWSGK
ncbi:MAG TPA: glycosyltransferase, partial [Rhodospirillaceae bacterium]|nr:glycosyltransferase [Rhodospirillaceae bacterium]